MALLFWRKTTAPEAHAVDDLWPLPVQVVDGLGGGLAADSLTNRQLLERLLLTQQAILALMTSDSDQDAIKTVEDALRA